MPEDAEDLHIEDHAYFEQQRCESQLQRERFNLTFLIHLQDLLKEEILRLNDPRECPRPRDAERRLADGRESVELFVRLLEIRPRRGLRMRSPRKYEKPPRP